MKVISFLNLFLCLCILPKQLVGQNCINWQQVIGGAEDERGSDIVYDEATGTYWACGYVTTSIDSTNILSKNGWIGNFDKNGNLLFEFETKAEHDLVFDKIDVRNDRIVVGGNILYEGNETRYAMQYGFNTNGEQLWWRDIYGNGSTIAVKILDDGSVILTKDAGENIYVVKFDSATGGILGVGTFGGSSVEGAGEMIYQNERLFIAGYNKSSDGHASNHLGGKDVWLIEIDPLFLTIINEKSFGGSSSEVAVGMTVAPDGNLVILAEILNAGGDISTSYGNNDYWAFKLDEDWNIVWEKTYGGRSSDNPTSIAAFSNGDVLIGGITLSFDTDITENFGYFDTWLARLNGETGDLIWGKSIGGNDLDYTAQININKNDEIVAIGNTDSNSIGCKSDCTTPHEFQNIWVYSLNEEIILSNPSYYNTFKPTATKVFCIDGWVDISNASSKTKQYKIYDVNGALYGTYTLQPFTKEKVFVGELKNRLLVILNDLSK